MKEHTFADRYEDKKKIILEHIVCHYQRDFRRYSVTKQISLSTEINAPLHFNYKPLQVYNVGNYYREQLSTGE